jgi:threonine aldolase
MKYIDLRSDTVTEPTEEMREAMKNAPVGDDVYGDDPTVNLLEDKSASVLGKEAALFVPSGTFGNQLSILTHTLRGDEVLIPEENHIVIHEAGASAVIAGVQLRFVPARYGTVDPNGLEERIRIEDLHAPRTGLICMENAHSSGAVVPLANMEEVSTVSKKAGIPIHLDGARIFNAAAAMNCEPKDIARYADSVMFCLSKGLCAPAGSILAGSADFVRRARKNRKIMGGALRQAGVLAAPGIIALEKMSPRLAEDHQNAKVLASALSKIRGITVYANQLDINMVFFSVAISETSLKASGLKTAATDLSHYLVGKFLEKGIKINGAEGSVFRFVTHYWIRSEHVRYVSECFEEILDAYYRTNA